MSKVTDPKVRKAAPVATGVLDFFPDAMLAVANLSLVATQQHHPDKPMHWDKSKSTDHADCIVRHLIDRGTLDSDGIRHSAKVAWRALALLQTEIENESPIISFDTDDSGGWRETRVYPSRDAAGDDQC